MLNDVGLKIKRSKDRLLADKLEQVGASIYLSIYLSLFLFPSLSIQLPSYIYKQPRQMIQDQAEQGQVTGRQTRTGRFIYLSIYISIYLSIYLFIYTYIYISIQDAARGINPSQQAETAEKVEVLTDKINVLVDQAEKAGCEVVISTE